MLLVTLILEAHTLLFVELLECKVGFNLPNTLVDSLRQALVVKLGFVPIFINDAISGGIGWGRRRVEEFGDHESKKKKKRKRHQKN